MSPVCHKSNREPIHLTQKQLRAHVGIGRSDGKDNTQDVYCGSSSRHIVGVRTSPHTLSVQVFHNTPGATSLAAPRRSAGSRAASGRGGWSRSGRTGSRGRGRIPPPAWSEAVSGFGDFGLCKGGGGRGASSRRRHRAARVACCPPHPHPALSPPGAPRGGIGAEARYCTGGVVRVRGLGGLS